MSTIALLIIAVIVIACLLWLNQPGDNPSSIRAKIAALLDYGRRQEYMLSTRLAVVDDPKWPIYASLSEIDKNLHDALGAIIIRVDNDNPNERDISIIDSSLNNIWKLRRRIDLTIQRADPPQA